MKNLLLCFVGVLLGFAPVSAKEASHLLARAEEAFGPPLDAKLHLYRIRRERGECGAVTGLGSRVLKGRMEFDPLLCLPERARFRI
jgi:hypothetical protein